MRGRKPKPSHLKVVGGTSRKSRENPAEPKPRAGLPVPPPHLRPRAREAWDYMLRLLDSMGVITVADAVALERLAECYADLLDARASLAQPLMWHFPNGGVVEVAPAGEMTYLTRGKDGFMARTRPEAAQIADLDRRLKAYLGEFGLTPATRSKIQAGKDGAPDALAEFFG